MFHFFKFFFPKPKPTIADIAVTNGNFDILVAALSQVNLVDTFADRHADFTVFAPTDAAFTELAITLGIDVSGLDETGIATAIIETLVDITGSQAAADQLLTNILLYHVKDGGSTVQQLQATGTVETLLTDATFTIDGTELVDNDPDVEDPEFIEGLTDIKAANGTIQAIDRVLLPIDIEEAVAQPTIAEIAATNGNFDILVEALTATGLVGTFADRDGAFTVFAPTDAAFTELAITLGIDVAGLTETQITAEILSTLEAITGSEAAANQLLTEILLYHVKAGESTVAELQADGTVETLLSGASFTVDGNELVDADPEVEDPEFIEGLTDIEAVNGNIQAIDRVLLPIDIEEAVAQPTIADIVLAVSGDSGFDSNAGDFDILRDALTATNLVGAVADRDADFTVFAPTDEAFGKLAVDLGFDGDASDESAVFNFIAGATGYVSPDDPGLLDDVLLYHVAPEGRTVAELQADGTIDTVQGDSLTVQGKTLVDNDPDVKDPKLIEGATDIEAANGVVQAIDRVLLPADLADATPEPTEINGSFRRDHLIGTDGDDVIRGFFGRDRLFGGDGDDELFGGLGRDRLSGGDGDDTLTGGLGRDRFDFSHLSGHDVVTDFGWRDKLIFSKDDFANAREVLAATSDQGAGAFIEGENGSVFLAGVDADHLSGRDFLFV